MWTVACIALGLPGLLITGGVVLTGARMIAEMVMDATCAPTVGARVAHGLCAAIAAGFMGSAARALWLLAAFRFGERDLSLAGVETAMGAVLPWLFTALGLAVLFAVALACASTLPERPEGKRP